ncbi:MAG: lipoprotein-releasing ABC transporter permease subunit [Proteobacteria bacterium]|nr:lipoprotein-releasing ABC transporter permease subunit [Pseudomonadota bacterium]
MPFEWQIGWRLVRSRRGGFVSFIAGASMLGIALGVAALVIVLSVVNGFQREVRDRMLDAVPHIELQLLDGVDPEVRAELPAKLRGWPGVRAVAPFVQLQGLLGRGDTLQAVQLRGIDPAQEGAVSTLAQRLPPATLAALQPGSRRVLLGRELARSLHVQAGDDVTLVRPALQPGESPRLLALHVAGTVDSGHYEFDKLLALMHLDDVAALAGGQGTRGLSVRVQQAEAAPAIAAALRDVVGPGIGIADWTRTNRGWFESVQIQKRMIGIILALIVAVAAFNLTSTLVMTVVDRRGDIAILRTLGARPASVMAIFMVQGAASGVVGTAAGLLLGLAVALNLDRLIPAIEALVGRRLIDAQVYLIDHLPSDPRASELLWIAGVSLALSLAATLYPSWRAATLKPAEALRHE